jgi:hypothetical protein
MAGMHNQELPKSDENGPSRALTLVERPFDASAEAASEADARHQPFRDTRVSPLAGFVTQLIACRRRLPEYRTRRLAEPGEATQRYDAVEHRPAIARRRFERLY